MAIQQCWYKDCTEDASESSVNGLCDAHEAEHYHRQRMQKIITESANPAMDALRELTGWHSDGEQAFADAFFKQHRTTQQSIIRLFMRLLITMDAHVQKDGMARWADLRNQDSFRLAQLIVKNIGGELLMLPYL